MIQQVPVNSETVSLLQKLQLAPNEGVLAVKFVFLRQATLSAGEAQAKIDSAPSAILLGNLDEVKAQLLTWLDEAIAAYKKE